VRATVAHALLRAASRLLSTLVFLLCPTATATSIVAILRTGSIVIVADGVVTGLGPDGKPAQTTICKIRCFGPVCVYASGRYDNRETGYDVWKRAQAAILRGGGAGDIADRFDRDVRPTLARIVKLSTKEKHEQWMKGTPVTSVSFALVKESGPEIVTLEYSTDKSGKLKSPRRTRYRAAPDSPSIVTSGTDEAMRTAILRDRSGALEFARLDPAAAAENWINLEIEASRRSGRNDVGAPLAVIEITRTGARPLPGRSGACAQ
jgi:hypothetical protein